MLKRHMIACALLIWVVGVSAFAVPIQWSAAVGGNGHWYELISNSSQTTWAQAQQEILGMSYQGLSGYFATATSAAENEWIYGTVVGQGYAWLGGADDGAGWRWANGEDWTYSAWVSGQPDGFLGGVQHTLYYGAAPLWDDAPDHWVGIPSQYVVEYGRVPEIPGALFCTIGLWLAALIRRRG
jgi:hypothetical protein